jgi:protein O-mannosyl-transferase
VFSSTLAFFFQAFLFFLFCFGLALALRFLFPKKFSTVDLLTATSWFRRDWFWGAMLTLSVVVTYVPVSQAGFVYDDGIILTGNPCIVGPLGLKEIWTTSAADICPFVLSTFWLEHGLWGLNPLPYHLVNILLHGFSAVVLWRALKHLRVPGAWIGAAFWAIHPVNVESVAWITEMKNTESGLFFLLSVFFFIRLLRAIELGGRTGSRWNYVLTLLFAGLAITSKSSTVILPIVLCLCAWWIEGRWYWRNLARTAPIFLMASAGGLLSIWTQALHFASVTDPRWVRTWPERVVAAGDAIWFYLGKLLFPYPLILIYPRWQIDARQWDSYLPLLGAIFILVLFWHKREHWPRAWLFAFACFLVALLPALGLIDNFIFEYSLVFDHFQYLASMGPLALAGAGLARFSDFALPKNVAGQIALCSVLLVILGATSWQRTLVFKDAETLWTDTLAKNRNCWVGEVNLGSVLREEGQTDEAIGHFQNALKINPTCVVAQNNLGDALFEKGQADEAIGYFQKALEIDPNFAPAHNNLGVALLQKGQLDRAIVQFQKAIEIYPNFPQAYYSLGGILFQKGRLNEAVNQFQKVLEITPNSFEAHYGIGRAFIRTGQLEQGIAHFQEVLRLNPDFKLGQDALAEAQDLMRERNSRK